MPIYFRNSPLREPFTFDSAGNHWLQEPVFRPNGHLYYHYLQTETGTGKIEIQGKHYLLEEGDGVLLAPSVSHSYRNADTDPEKEWFTSFVTVTGCMESSIGSILGNRQILFTDREQGEEITQIIADCIRLFEHSPVDARQLSVYCYHFLMCFVDGVSAAALADEPLYQRYVAPVIKEIETSYDSRLTVRELSRQVFVTPQYLSRLFGRYLGCSTYEYLTGYRISKAKEMLLASPYLNVQMIAGQVGFEDASHFISMFKKMTGITPTEFRDKSQGDRFRDSLRKPTKDKGTGSAAH